MFKITVIILNIIVYLSAETVENSWKSIEDMELLYEDDKNAMIAITEPGEGKTPYEYFYDELDNRSKMGSTMDIIYFGPASSFLRLDAESILHLLSHTKKEMIPVSRALLAWDILTDGKTSAFLHGRELKAFGNLLNLIPEEDLYYINMGDSSVVRYFANHKSTLSNRKFGILIASYRRYFGYDWYKSSDYINDLGYLLCGFPASEMERISPSIFKELNVEVLSKLDRCSAEQTQVLYNIATKPDAYGKPYRWFSHEIVRMDTLFNCIPKNEISSIKLQAITAISPRVMLSLNQNKLNYFTKPQIIKMNPKTRRTYILRMQLKYSLDTSQIPKKDGTNIVSSEFIFIYTLALFNLNNIIY